MKKGERFTSQSRWVGIPWNVLEPPITEPPSFSTLLGMTIRDSSYMAAQPHGMAQVHSGIPQDGETGFLHPKIKVTHGKGPGGQSLLKLFITII
uniref:Uncharacterized protein n=1 Tax=Sphaerodactylus townsendi TaxID=933632 RepID=A0ACB8ERY0_9SAUR